MGKTINLSMEQWRDLKKIVSLGATAERRMAGNIEIDNEDVKIVIETDDKVKITLRDD